MKPVDEKGRRLEALLGERYEFLGLLGHGGFASVYQVRSRSLGRLEALKALDETRADSGFTGRFEAEARLSASLDHPHIVKIYDFGNADGALWYTMQFVDGPSVEVHLRRHGRFQGESAARIAIPLLDALEYSHARGVVHRDIKPANILLEPGGRPVLTDFGIAKGGDQLSMTRTGAVLGTPGYLSPEQLRGEKADGRSDLYAFGVTLYEMLSGSLPFSSEEPVATVVRRLTEDAEPLSRRAPTVEPGLSRIVMRALARDRDGRYASAGDMKRDLEAFLAGSASPEVPEPSPAPGAVAPAPPPAAVPERAAAPPSAAAAILAPRRGRRIWLAGAAAVVLAALGVVVLSTSRRARIPVEPAPPPEIASPAAPPFPAEKTPVQELPTPAAATPAVAEPRRPASTVRPTPLPPAPEPRRQKYPPDFEEPPVPALPAELAATCAGRIVGLSLIVAENGTLAGAKVISSSGVSACDDVVLAAVRRARYKPAIAADGNPVEGRFIVAVPF